MEDAISSGILAGRPYGGVCIAWSPKLDHLINPISNFRHKRVVAVELKTQTTPVLLICIYMPFFNSSQRAECMADTVDALTMIENLIEAHPSHQVIIGGDINSEMKGKSPFDSHWNDFIARYQLECCDRFFPTDSYTYRHDSLNQIKWNDHFLVSSSLLQNDKLNNFHIVDSGDNVSDHLPIVMSLNAQFDPCQPHDGNNVSRPTLKWEKISDSQKTEYTRRLGISTNSRKAPSFNCESVCRCRSDQCKNEIQREYDFLMQSLKDADSFLPRHKPGIEKDWWTEQLTDLRNKSIEVHSLWKEQGRPRQGAINAERLQIHACYKRAIRVAQRMPKQQIWDRLHSNLASDDTNNFWKSWRRLYSKNNSHLPPVVNGCSSKAGIANSFKESFQKNCTPNNHDSVRKLNDSFTHLYEEYCSKHTEQCDCNSHRITVYNVLDGLMCLKSGKSADEDSISAEHLLLAPVNYLVRITNLFNLMLRHGCVPKQFRFGYMVPIVKDQQGNLMDLSNYRGITISPIASKLFEHVLKIVFSEYLETSESQFGFKKNSSTVHALHCLRQTVDYYVNNGSRVFCAFLDASKAFDRVVHAGLFTKLIKRNVPLVFIDVIISWYDGLACRVKWDDHFSDWFWVTAGVRQGGVLSPDFYSIYVDDLIQRLKDTLKGCYHFGIFAAALFYADDMAILAPSLKGLKSLLNICNDYCLEWDIGLNSKKSKLLYFGKRVEVKYDISFNGETVEWTDEWKYLGVSLKSSHFFNCSVTERIRKFYRCANAIFRIDGRSTDTVMLRLVETHCVPLLTYAIEVVHVANRDEKRQLRVAYNSLFRKIFGYRWRESVTALQGFLGRPTWEQLVEKRSANFRNRLLTSGGDSLARMLLS